MNIIGIVGGMGPHAGLDLHRKVLEHTRAATDQEHLPVIHVSLGQLIGDRTRWLLTREGPSPAEGIFEAVATLERAGAGVIGMPCNTAHAEIFYNRVRRLMEQQQLRARLLHMPLEAIAELSRRRVDRPVGILATKGTYQVGIYQDLLAAHQFQALTPAPKIQDEIHQAIYSLQFGIKAQPNPVTEQARSLLLHAISHLAERGAGIILLACTELPLALPEAEIAGIPLLDNTAVLARALIRETCPERLKP